VAAMVASAMKTFPRVSRNCAESGFGRGRLVLDRTWLLGICRSAHRRCWIAWRSLAQVHVPPSRQEGLLSESRHQLRATPLALIRRWSGAKADPAETGDSGTCQPCPKDDSPSFLSSQP